jgi:flavin reductase (DIM6/NTAB) family NADH-FMN oxidoreductase RutF
VEGRRPAELVPLAIGSELWTRLFTVAPLVLVGTLAADGEPNVAPKHMAMPLGWESWFCFVCSPRHETYTNAIARSSFTVSYPRPELVVQTSLAASPREADDSKPALGALELFPATTVDGVLVAGCDLYLECELDRILDGFGENSLLTARIVAAAAEPSALRGPERDDGELVHGHPLLAYLHPGRFAAIAETNAFPFPAGFSH